MNIHKVITRTGDGSPTLYVPELLEHYHSVHGAIQESEFVYIEKALNQQKKLDIKVFEVGFGIGLNAYLSCLEAKKKKINMCYHSIEMYPVEKYLWLELNKYFNKYERGENIFHRIHECKWDEENQITRFFRLKKIKADMTRYDSADIYDVIYFDAFGPEAQPEMWTKKVFCKVSKMMDRGGILSTYSSKGQVRRNMRSAGLLVKRVPGPPGKREIIVASKPDQYSG